jgi:hypothetical protein
VIGGEHRVKALRQTGATVAPCLVLTAARWQDEDLQKLVTVRLNVLHGKLNPEKMALLYKEMAEKYGAEAMQKMFAFTDEAAFKKVVKGVQDGLKHSGMSREAQREASARVGKTKNMDELGRVLSKVFDRQGTMLQHGFIAFTHEGVDHVYVRMTANMKKAFDRVMAYCVKAGEDINEIMEPVTAAYADAVADKKPTKSEDSGGSES